VMLVDLPAGGNEALEKLTEMIVESTRIWALALKLSLCTSEGFGECCQASDGLAGVRWDAVQ